MSLGSGAGGGCLEKTIAWPGMDPGQKEEEQQGASSRQEKAVHQRVPSRADFSQGPLGPPPPPSHTMPTLP